MSSAPQPTGQVRRHEFFVELDRFWQRVTEGRELSQLWKQFRSDARASYRLYQRDFNRRREETQASGFLHTVLEFVWAFLEKLTPARRVLLLAGMVLLLIPAGGFSYHGKSGEVEVAEFDLRFYGGALIFVVLVLEVADRVVMKRDLEIARDIQSWLLPASPPAIPGLSMAFATRPANTVAGDYYDVFERPREPGKQPRFLFAVADVAGKSIPAALLMATLQASLRTLSATSATLADLVGGVNRYACTNSQSGLRFTTAFLAEFDTGNRTLQYINAGHNAPVLRRSSGTIERLAAGGLPLGIREDRGYECGSVSLQSGDWLVVFTDGLVEALNETGEEYGEMRMLSVLQSAAACTPAELLRQLMLSVDTFVGTTPQHDDVTCLLVKLA